VVTRKRRDQIALMRRAGLVVAEMHECSARVVRPRATTAEVDRVAREVLERRGARSSFLGYHEFPAVICTSPNDVIVHGIPGPTVLEEGDILSIDCGAIVSGWHADAAVTLPVGAVGASVEGAALAAGFTLVREYVGHGIGTAMHEEPQIPNYAGGPNRRFRLREGHVLAIEPMVNAGTGETRELDDGWTVVTADGRRSAHFEHTVAVTDHGPEVLTLPW